MFSCSIAENIAYGADDPSLVTAEQVEKVASVANAAAFIHNFPQGFNTVVGEKGVLLSGTFLLPLCSKNYLFQKTKQSFHITVSFSNLASVLRVCEINLFHF